MSENRKMPKFPVGQSGRRKLQKDLLKSTNPARTIETFQAANSLHTMMAKAFGTKSRHEAKSEQETEPLDTDSVMSFLTHLGVSKHEVHKRVSDALQKELENEIRKTPAQAQSLVQLLKSCWPYVIANAELRPVLWAVLKQLGDQTPQAVLLALSERDDDGALKHAEIFRPLPPLLKRLVWEADWDTRVKPEQMESTTPHDYLELVAPTLVSKMVKPLVHKYCSNPSLVEAANRPFVAARKERRVLTSQRRALSAATTTTSTTSTAAISTASLKTTTTSSRAAAPTNEETVSSGKAVSELRQFLGDTSGGTASYRPKLLYAVLSILMAQHGACDSPSGGAQHLHCSLVADILLSAGGPLPKAYQYVLSLARILDDSVKNGILTDKDMIGIQTQLRNIWQPDQPDPKESTNTSNAKADEPSTFLTRQLNRIITAGLTAMKDADPQNLFLNPVTDAIAPGYSKVISKPMCVLMMEQKVERNDYKSVSAWEQDVNLMFKNCIEYNRGSAGQWFRGEANRQRKVFKDEVLPQARRLYQVEVAKRNPRDDEESKKRKADKEGPQIEPLPACNKKRKKDNLENTPSMPALATMLLADPFVVRLMIDRILRSLRLDVMRGRSLPAAHTVVPSVLQVLHLAKWSTQLCAIRGKRFFLPDVGLKAPGETADPTALVPYESLRRYIPLLMRLLLEAELDKRLANRDDLQSAAQSNVPNSGAPSPDAWTGSPMLHVVVSLVEAAMVHICQPGNSHDASLSVSFPRFARALQQLSASLLDEKAFFLCLIESLLKHKSKLNRSTRDVVVSTWLDWLRTKGEKGSILSAAHEYMIYLLNEWASLGNLLLPRDMLLKYAADTVEVVNESNDSDEYKFAPLWRRNPPLEGFAPIKAQYERMLTSLPEASATQWKEQVGVADDAAVEEEGVSGKGGDEEMQDVDNGTGDVEMGNAEEIKDAE